MILSCAAMTPRRTPALVILLALAVMTPAAAADNRPDGLIPKVLKPITLDGQLDDWAGAFVTPVHIGHPDFADRGAELLFLWDEDNLYVGLRCLDRHAAHVGPDNQLWNGDAVEFYLDVRRGDQLGAKDFGPGTLHMFWTPFTGTEVKPRLAVRDLPAFRDFKLKGAEVAGRKTPWGYTAEFKLPWANFPGFVPKAGEVIGLDCELCSGDGGLRTDRTFVYSSPASVGSPSAFGRVLLVDKVDADSFQSFGRVLLPVAVTKSGGFPCLYATACLSPTIERAVTKVEGRLLSGDGKVSRSSAGVRRTLEGPGLALWTGQWELFDLPPGTYTVEVAALGKDGRAIVTRRVEVVHER
jgi:hypothetical protein